VRTLCVSPIARTSSGATSATPIQAPNESDGAEHDRNEREGQSPSHAEQGAPGKSGDHPEQRRPGKRACDGDAGLVEHLRELARGMRPAQLDAGLSAALRELARRAPLPVEVRATRDRFADCVETAAYFIACEGVTNAVSTRRRPG